MPQAEIGAAPTPFTMPTDNGQVVEVTVKDVTEEKTPVTSPAADDKAAAAPAADDKAAAAPAADDQTAAGPAAGTTPAATEPEPKQDPKADPFKVMPKNPEATKREDEGQPKAYVYSADTILDQLGAKGDEELDKAKKMLGNAGFTSTQLAEILSLLGQPNVATYYFGGSDTRRKAMAATASGLYLRQLDHENTSDSVNLGPVYVETSVGGNAALGIGYKSISDGIVKKSGFGIYIRADHLKNTGVRLNK